MKRKKHTPQQILEKLRAVDVELSQGADVRRDRAPVGRGAESCAKSDDPGRSGCAEAHDELVALAGTVWNFKRSACRYSREKPG